jgi:hypothetical protein
LNHAAADSGILGESGNPRVGITYTNVQSAPLIRDVRAHMPGVRFAQSIACTCIYYVPIAGTREKYADLMKLHGRFRLLLLGMTSVVPRSVNDWWNAVADRR